MQWDIRDVTGEVEDVRVGKAGDEDSLEKERRGLSLGRLRIHAHSMPNGVTFVRHSTYSLSKTHVYSHTGPSQC